MKKISINSSIRNYKISFSSSLKEDINKIYKPGDIFLIDKRVFKLHKLNKYINSKKILLINANEKAKSFERLDRLIKKILASKFRKNNRIIVIGGGITQDIGSFISSIILRGVEWIFIPTSFLSQCDSCVGGKTSINFFGKKNQIGNFFPPSAVYIHTRFLSSLNELDIRSGIGEMAHYFFVSSKKDFLFFKKYYQYALKRDQKSYLKLIYKSLDIKKKFIELDEFDKKERLILNYGHTFGHAIESITDFKIPHGIAVANGMNIANYISLNMKLISQGEFDDMNLILSEIYRNMKPKKIDTKKYIYQLRKDKKNTNNNLTCILTNGIGKMFIRELKFDRNLFSILSKYTLNYLK